MILKQVSYATGAEVVFKGMCFEMHGLEHEVRSAVTMLLDLDVVKVNLCDHIIDVQSLIIFVRTDFPS